MLIQNSQVNHVACKMLVSDCEIGEIGKARLHTHHIPLPICNTLTSRTQMVRPADCLSRVAVGDLGGTGGAWDLQTPYPCDA